MGTRQTRLYYNTGFNAGNTPGYTSILNNANYLDLEQHWDYQDFFLASMKLKATWDQVKNADYLKYGDAYYWVTGCTMINNNLAELSLQLDALASMGGAKSLSYTSGILKRAHPLSDGEFQNTLAEPIAPQRALRLQGTANVGPQDCSCDVFTMSTLAFSDNITVDSNGNVKPLHGTATEYKVAGEDAGSVIIPNSPKGASGCQVGGTYISGINYYVSFSSSSGQKVANQIAYFRSLGLEQAIVGNYAVPDFWCDGKYSGYAATNAIPARVTSFSKLQPTQVSATAYRPYSSRWKKSIEMNNSYTVMSKLTGESKTYKTQDIVGGGSRPLFSMCADINIHGKPYIWPSYYRGANTSGYIGSNGISGMQWLDIPVVATGASGSIWIGNNYARDSASLARDTVELGYNSVKNVIGNIAGSASKTNWSKDVVNEYGIAIPQTGTTPSLGSVGMLGGVIDTSANLAFSGSKLQYAADKLDTDFAQATQFVTPSVNGALADGLQTSIPNGFYIYHFMMDNRDVEKFDDFFTKYGYAQDCKFDKSYMSDHWGLGYVYIQTSDIHIARSGMAANVGVGVKNLAEEQLNGGIRIWDRLPS